MLLYGGSIWPENLRPFVAYLADCVGYDFLPDEMTAIEYGVKCSNCDADQWYDCTFAGSEILRLRLARDGSVLQFCVECSPAAGAHIYTVAGLMREYYLSESPPRPMYERFHNDASGRERCRRHTCSGQNWIYLENLQAFIDFLAGCVAYRLLPDEMLAIEYGVKYSDYDANQWYDYEFDGSEVLRLRLARDGSMLAFTVECSPAVGAGIDTAARLMRTYYVSERSRGSTNG
jgi:hypothetical protein